MIGCGPGGACCGNCQAGGGLGLAPAVPVGGPNPATTQVLYDYAVRKLEAHEPFYISAQLNSRALSADGLGFITAILAAASAVAGTVATVAPQIATIVAASGALKGGGGGSSTASPTADDIAAAIMPQVAAQLQAQGVTLPASIAQKTTAASLLDAFGSQNRGLVIAGAAGLGLLLLFKILRR